MNGKNLKEFFLLFGKDVNDNGKYCICTLEKLLVSLRALEVLRLDLYFVEVRY